MNGNYVNWDTWETVNWCLNSEPIVNALMGATYNEAKNIIFQHMTMVNYTYGNNVDLKKIDIKEVLETVRE